jgi:hypothetical protein
VTRELEVRLVDHHNGVGRLEQIDEERLVGKTAGGVVRVRDHDNVDVALGDAREHRFLIDREVGPPRNLDDFRACDLRIDPVHREGRRHVEDLAPGTTPSEQHVEDEFVAAVAHKYVLGVETVGIGDEAPQLVRRGIRIAVELEV